MPPKLLNAGRVAAVGDPIEHINKTSRVRRFGFESFQHPHQIIAGLRRFDVASDFRALRL